MASAGGDERALWKSLWKPDFISNVYVDKSALCDENGSEFVC